MPGVTTYGLGWGLRGAALDEAAPALAVRRAPGVIGLFRARRRHAAPPGDTTRAALPMLPPDVRAAIAAVLRDQDGAADAPRKVDPQSRVSAAGPPGSPPPYLFVVRTGEGLTFNSLRTLSRARPDLVGVVFDRRWMDERHRHAQPGQGERHRIERRRPTPAPGWVEHGFVLVSPAPERPPESAKAAVIVPPPEVSVQQLATAVAPVPATDRPVPTEAAVTLVDRARSPEATAWPVAGTRSPATIDMRSAPPGLTRLAADLVGP